MTFVDEPLEEAKPDETEHEPTGLLARVRDVFRREDTVGADDDDPPEEGVEWER